jgi:hypothetical protein
MGNRPSGWIHPFSAERVAERAPSEHDDAVADLNAHLERNSIRVERCAVCGGLNPGDISHTRCA